MKKSHLWIFAVGIALLGIVFRFMGNFLASFFSAALFALIVPLTEWQDFIQKYVNGRAKKVLIIALAVLFCISSVIGLLLISSVEDPMTSHTDTVITTTTKKSVTTSTTPATSSKTTTTTIKISTTTTPKSSITTPVTTTKPTTTTTTIPTTAHAHDFISAACETPKTCSECGVTEGDALGHSWEDATCNSPKRCSECGATSGSAAGHSYSNGTCWVCGQEDPNYTPISYVLNTNTKKFHYPSCRHVDRIEDENREDINTTRDEIVSWGYEPCGTCNP